MSATAPLDELRSADEARFGGKSAALGELLAGGIPVPPGFAVSTDAFADALRAGGVGERIAARLAGLDVDDHAAVAAAAADAAQAIAATPLPGALRDEIARRYADLARAAGEEQPPVAVRSSACGEDSAEATFAGQQETYLWVRGADAVCAAVRDCWASLFSVEAITYRARLGDAARDAAMGVAVQLMVDAEVSGVLFTCNPVSGDPSVVAVDASWGLGLSVVGGEVTPDQYLVSKVTHEVVRQTVGDKTIEYRPAPGGHGAATVAVDPDRARAVCLDGERLRALAVTARTVQEHFGGHQDVEWAFARTSGELFVLQARPVTAVAEREAPKPASAMSLILGTFGVENHAAVS